VYAQGSLQIPEQVSAPADVSEQAPARRNAVA
jgi:hypothetical protein